MLEKFHLRQELAPGLYALLPLREAEEAWAILQWLRKERLWPSGGMRWERPTKGRFGLGKVSSRWSGGGEDRPFIEVVPGEFGEGSRERFDRLVAERAEEIAEGNGLYTLRLADWQSMLGVRPRRRADLPGLIAKRPGVVLDFADRVARSVPAQEFLYHAPQLGPVYGPGLEKASLPDEISIQAAQSGPCCLAEEIELWEFHWGLGHERLLDLSRLSFADFRDIWTCAERGSRLGPSYLQVLQLAQERKKARRNPRPLYLPGTLRALEADFGRRKRSWGKTAQAILAEYFDPHYARQLADSLVLVKIREQDAWESAYDLHVTLDPLKLFAGLIPLQITRRWDGLEVIARVSGEVCDEMLSLISKPDDGHDLSIQIIYLVNLPSAGGNSCSRP